MEPRQKAARHGASVMPLAEPIPEGTPFKMSDAREQAPGALAPLSHRAGRTPDRDRAYQVRAPRGPSVQGVYVISIASRMLEMHPQTLRKYERMGFVRPSRTEGKLRLYSEEDLLRLRMIKELVERQGMNLAGVELALSLLHRISTLQQHLEALLNDPDTEALEPISEELEGMLRLLGFSSPQAPRSGD